MALYAIHVCGNPDQRGLDAWEMECPNVAQHALHPLGYSDWHEWARTMGETHRQHRCPDCMRLAIWEPR